jgi:hypothetical protein
VVRSAPPTEELRPPGGIVIDLLDLRARVVVQGLVDRTSLATVLAALREGAR